MRLERRDLLRLGLTSAGAALLAAYGIRPTPARAEGESDFLPVSPLVGGVVGANGRVYGSAFLEEMPVPRPVRPTSPGDWLTTPSTPGGPINKALPYPDSPAQSEGTLYQNPFRAKLRTAVHYRLPIIRTTHQFTALKVLPINGAGHPIQATFNGAPRSGVPLNLPASPMSLINGTFPGPLIDARYEQPCVVRFENVLKGWNGSGWDDGADYGVPSSLTHLHNAHSSPECDGNPNQCPLGYNSYYSQNGRPWYYDNLYLNHPPDGDERERQSFLWFHDHRMNNTSANVYSGMVGLYVLYNENDAGDETKGLGLPGVPAIDPDGTPFVKYDVPLAIFDTRFDDGVTPHNGAASGGYRSGLPMEMPMQDGNTHPQSWGKPFFGHYPEAGFIGDVFTVNGIAYPVMHVKQRKYRFRVLDCSISRWYEFMLMAGSVKANPGQQGQYMLDGSQCMKMTQIATDGGLIPQPLVRDTFRLAPSKRREVVIDFTKYQDGTITKVGDEIYLTDILKMSTGTRPDGYFKSGHGVPLLKFVIDGPPPEPDRSYIPPILCELPPVPYSSLDKLPHRQFTLLRGPSGWQIVDQDERGGFFDPLHPLATPAQGSAEVWTFVNGGGGHWTHPLHVHMEEHHVITRNGAPSPSDALHADDNCKDDVIALEPDETVVIYRKFRSFKGPYVAHCHNLAHEDNAMMFGWNIV
jgi:FtsP/CotA-like multicopper oxidase with cupredoxin domain